MSSLMPRLAYFATSTLTFAENVCRVLASPMSAV
jgi:hypothetical protein